MSLKISHLLDRVTALASENEMLKVKLAEAERRATDIVEARDWAERFARDMRYAPDATWCSVFDSDEADKMKQAQLLAEYVRRAVKELGTI